MSKPTREFGVILLASVEWKPVSPNRTAGQHWSVKHRHRKAAQLAWERATAGNAVELSKLRVRLSS